MQSLDEIFGSLPSDLSNDDVLIDCETTELDVVDVYLLIEELLVRRNTKSCTLLRPDARIADEARRVTQSIDRSERLYIVDQT